MRLDGKQIRDDSISVAKLVPPSSPAYAATIPLDVASRNDFTPGLLTGPVSFSFTNPAAGRRGTITVRQDGTGSRAVSFTVPSGYVLFLEEGTTTLAAASGPYAVTRYRYEFYSIGGLAILCLGRSLLSPLAPAAILGSALKADWDSRSGVAASTWTDAVGSKVMTASGSPVFGVDTGFFNGLSVWKMVGAQLLDTGDLVSPLVAGTADLYVSVIMRQTAIAAGSLLWFLYRPGPSTSAGLLQNASTSVIDAFFGPSPTATSFTPNTQVHRYELIANASGARLVLVDGTTVLSSSGGATGSDVQRVAVPSRNSASSAANYASIRIASPVPTATQLAQLRAYDQVTWGTAA